MADIKTNQSKVYNALKGMGFSGIGNDEAEFANLMAKPQNREKVYKALTNKGYKGIGKDQAAFDSLIYQTPEAQPQVTEQQPVVQQPVAQQLPPPTNQPYKPSDFDMMRYGATINNAQYTTDNVTKGIDALSEAQKSASPFGSGTVGLGNNKSLRKGKKTFDAEKGAFVDTYLTSDGRQFTDVQQANNVQAEIDYNNEIRRTDETLRTLGVDPDAIRNKDVNHLLGDAYAERDRLKALMGSDKEGKEALNNLIMSGGFDPEVNDKIEQRKTYSAALRLLDRRIDALEAARDNGGFWQGTWDVLSDPSTYSFGLTDLEDAKQMKGISKKIEEAKAKGVRPQLTDSELALARNYMLNEQAQAMNQEKNWYQFGKGFGQTLSFMKDFAVTGGGFMGVAKGGMALGAKGGTKLATKMLGDYMAKNLGTRVLAKTMIYGGKGLGLAAGAEVGGLALNNTAQAASSVADIMDRQMGHLTVGKDGNLTFEDSKNLGEAVLKSQLSRGGENASELVGLAFDAVPGILGRVIQKTKVGQFAKKIANNKYWKGYEKGMNYLGVQSVWGEGMEEEYNMARDVLIGESNWFKDPNDPNKPAFFDGEQQLKTWEQVGITSMLLRVPAMIATGTQQANYYANMYNLNTADRQMRELFGDNQRYESVKAMLDGANNGSLPGVLNNLMNNAELTPEEKKATFYYANDLVKVRGFNIGNVLAAAEGFQEPPKVASYNVKGNGFDEVDAEGNVLNHYDFDSPEEMSAALYEAQQTRFDEELNTDIGVMKSRPDGQYDKLVQDYLLQSETRILPSEFEQILAKPSLERTDEEQALVVNFSKILHDTVYDNTMLHEEKSDEDGASVAEQMAIDLNASDPTEAQQITNEFNAARQARDEAFARNEDLAMEVLAMEQQGIPHQDIISALNTFRPQELQTVIDYYNKMAKYQGLVNRMSQKIDEEAANHRQRVTHKGTIDGVADVSNVHTISDGTNEYFLVSGDVTTNPSTGEITGSTSGLIIGMDLDGSFVNIGDTNGYRVMPVTQSLDQYEEAVRVHLQQEWTQKIDPNQTMNRQQQVQSQQQGGTAGSEAVVNNDNGANEPPVTAPETPVVENTQQPQQPAITIESVTDKDGIKRYENGVAVDDAIADIIADGFDVNEIADASIAEAQTTINKIDGKSTKTRKDLMDKKRAHEVITYYNNVKARWAELNAEAQQLANSEENVNVQPEKPIVEEKPVSSQQSLTVEEQKQQRIAEAKAKYGELFDDDFTKANDVYELVSMWVGRKRNLAWDDVNGKRGLQKELGWTRRIGGDTKYIETLLAKKGEGMSVDDFAHMVWESPENDVMGEKRFSTEEIKEALLDLLKSAQSKSEVVDYALNTRISAAEATLKEQQMLAQEEAEQQAEVPAITEEEIADIEANLPFVQSTDEDIPDAPIVQLEKVIAELQQQEGMPPISLVDTDLMNEDDWITLAYQIYGGAFVDEEAVNEVRNYALETGVFRNEDGAITVYSDSQTPEDVKYKIQTILDYANTLQEEGRNDGRDTIVQRTETETSQEQGSERQAKEGRNDSESQGSTESGVDEYLLPRNAEEEKIIADVEQELNGEIFAQQLKTGAAKQRYDQKRSEESERATDLFGDDNTLNQPGQLFDNSDMPIDRSVEGVERRASAEREAWEAEKAKMERLMSPQERNSRVRGALDNYRRQTSIEAEAVPQPTEQSADPMEVINQQAQEFKREQEEKKKPKSNNTIFTDEAHEEVLKKLRDKFNNLNAGFDPEIALLMLQDAGYHIEKGARKIADCAKAMIEELGDFVRPYIKSAYNAVRDYPGMEEVAKEMSSFEEVQSFDVQNFDKTNGNTVNEHKNILPSEEKDVDSQEKSVSEEQREARSTFVGKAWEAFLKAMKTGEKPFKSITDLRKFAQDCGMEVDTEGRDDILLQELVENALVRAAREYLATNYGGSFNKEAFDDIVKLYYLQPTISQRSSNRIKMQQYSTPLPMSFVADAFVYPAAKNGMVLEPTAGNGMLVFGLEPGGIHANELDKTRLDNLQQQAFAKVTNQDATQPFEGEQYDAIIANPPFGAAPAKDYDGKMISGLDEQIALNALSKMKDNGKAAIIIGGNMEYGTNGAIKSDKAFFTYLYDHYNVKGVIDMDGKLYSRQGTTFPTRMILIDGRRSEEERAQSKVYPPTLEKAAGYKVDTFDELYDLAERITNNRKKTDGNEVLRTSTGIALPDTGDTSGNTNRAGYSGQPRQNESDGGMAGTRSSDGGSQETANVNTAKRSRSRSVGVQQPGIPGLFDSQETASEPQSQTGASGERGSVSNNGRNGSTDVQGSGTPNSGVGLNAEAVPQPTEKTTPKVAVAQQQTQPVKPKVEEKRELNTDKLSYRPHNTAYSLESVAPAAMVEAMDNMLKKIEKEHGNIDAFVTRELGYDSIEDMHNALAAEQVDSVAMAIYQMKHGQGMIIGDQTGVGKGRQMAALIRWACRQGKKPVFITQKADLFSDIYRDLVDIGSGELRPFIFNSDGAMVDNNGVAVHKPLSAATQAKVFAGDKLPDGFDFAVLTYSQVNTGDKVSQDEAKEAAKEKKERYQKKKKKGGEKPTPKATFLRALAKDNYMFLDESHTAAGKSNTGAYFQSILKTAKAVTFASATFAKRPDTMPMYALRTAMSKAKVKADELIKIIENGGVTLQEIMSRALTQAGQMVRRERDMSDVVTDWKTVDDPETVRKARENYDKTIEAFNAIINFQRNWVGPHLDNLSHQLADVAASAGMTQGTEDMGISNVPFASKTYNYTKQLMLALKVDAIVDEVVKEIEAGRHPVIALENTMGSLLSEYAPGDVIEDTTFAASLLKGLKGVLRYTIKDEDGNEQHAELSPSQLGPEGEAAYHAVEDLIRESTSGIFISPLDAITEKLQQKGYKVGELTGRNEMAVLDENTGEYKVQRRTDKDKKKLARDFNSGALDVLILNKSASTGISLHASEKFSDQRQRTMIIAQPLADINDYMQMIGRIDRTGQVHRGYYINLGLPVPAEGRFLMMLSTKLKSLNANTTTSQESESNDVEAPDLLNKYGSRVVIEYLRDNPDIYIKLGEPLKRDKGKVSVQELDSYDAQDDDARKITGYVALLTTKEQDDFYNDVVRRYNDLIKYLNDTGSNDLKISVLPLRARTIEKQVSSEGSEPNGQNPFAQDAYVEWVEMDVLKKPMKAAEVGAVIDQLNPEVSGDNTREVHAKTRAQEKVLNQRMTPRVKQISDTVEKEYQAKMDKENARYEEAKAKAEEAIKEQTEKINNSKRTPEQKKEAIEKYRSDKMQSIEESHNNMVNKIEASKERIAKPLRDFEVGDSYLVPDDLDTDTFMGASPAIFCGFKCKDEGITPSTTLAVFCTLDGRRKIEIKLSDWGPLTRIKNHTEQNWDAAHEVTLSNWDSQVSSESRTHGFIMTGNILQAFADAGQDGRVSGQLVTYTDIDGNVHDGILMSKHWEPSMLRGSTVPIKNRENEIAHMSLGDHITSADGNVVIERGYTRFTISVPKSKKTGGQYYENDRLLDLIDDRNFYPHRGTLMGDVPVTNIRDLVDVLNDLGVQLKSDNQVQFDADTEMGQAKANGRRYDMDIDNVEDEINKTLNEYNTIAPVYIVRATDTFTVDELRELFGNDMPDNMAPLVREYLRNHKTEGLHIPTTGKILIFADIIGKRGITAEEAIFHENLHAALHKTYGEGAREVCKRFWDASTEPNQEDNKDIILGELQDQQKAEEEYFVRITARKMTNGTIDGVFERLNDEDTELLEGILNDLGYDRRRETERREGKELVREDKGENHSLLSRGNNGRVSEYKNRIAKHIDELVEKLGTKARTTVYHSFDELPEDEKEHIREAEKRGRKVRGWYENGHVYLYLPHIDSEYQAEKTIWHETVAHHGLRELIGAENLDKLLKQLWLTHKEGAMGEWVTERMQENGWQLNEAIEEYLARKAEKNPFKEPGLWQRLKWMLAEVLHKMGFATDPTIADVQYLFWQSQNRLTENDPMGVIKQQAFLHHLEREAANTPYVNMNASTVEDIYNPNAEGAYDDGVRHSEETDEEVIERLEKEPKVKVYRAMQLIDGKLYPPMAAKQNGKLVNPIELGKWEKADEHPEMADENGKFKLDKGNGKSLKAAYNPYIHTSTTMLNDQFSEAQNRDNLVVVEVEVPESELTSGYKAEKAKDSVGKMDWKAGIIQGQLSGTREVILSRWDKPVRIVPTEEVAQHIADMIKGKVEVMPTNVVTPQQRKALEKLGVKFVETDNRGFIKEGENAGKSYSSVYGKKKGRRYDMDIDDPLSYSAKAVYDERLNRVETVFSEAYQDAMVSLKTAQNAIAQDKDIPDSQNAYMAENLMHGKNKNEQDLFNKMFRDPMIDTINKIMNLTGMNWGDIDRYVYTKSGLERNREFFVRDWLEAKRNKTIRKYEDLSPEEQDIYDSMAATIEQMFDDGDIATEEEKNKKLAQALQKAHQKYIDQVETDWVRVKNECYQYLKDDVINYAGYLNAMTDFIQQNIGDYIPEEHDYSGFRAMFGDEDGNYNEAEIIDELMNTEDAIETENVNTLWEQINAATQYGLERYREAGMRSDEQIDRIEQMFHFYVPMRGFKAETGEDMYQYFTGKDKAKSYVGGLLKHAKGRGSEANYPISTIFAMSYKAISDCNQNLVNQKLYRLCQANPNDLVILSDSWAVFNEITGEWEESAPDIPEDASEDEVREATLAWEDSMRQLASENKAKKIHGKATFDYKPMDKKNQSEHIVDVRINGQPKKMIVTGNPRMAQALNGQLRFGNGKNVFSKWNAAIKNMMASLFTSYSPTFALRNMFRDWTHFRMMLGVREGHGYASQANKYYRQSLFKMVGLFKKYRDGTLDESNEMERDFKDFMDNGGITGYVFMQKADDIQKSMEKLYKDQKAGKVIRLNNNLLEKILHMVEAMNEGIENNARFATYRASRHYAGRTKARSAYDAKEITVNFNRKGAGGKTAGFKSQNKKVEDAAKVFGVTSQILGEGRIFFNATVQAIATTFKNFQKADGSLNGKYIAKWAAKYALPPFMFGLLLPAINKALANAFGGDDDDPYANLPEWTRRRNLCFYVGHDNFITIPVGQELAAFLALGDIVAGNTYSPDLKPVDRNMGDEMIDVMNTFSPVDVSTKITKGGLMEDPISEVTGRTFSVLAPLVAVEQNLGWTGRPIYREDKFQNDQYTPEYQMVYQSTNPVLVNASKLLHKIGGGDDIVRGKLEVNPAIIQYLWEQYTGGPGKVFSNTISIGKDAKDILSGNESDFNMRKVEGLKAFVAQGDDRTQYYRTLAKYRKYEEDAKKLYHDVKGYENAATNDPTALMKLEEITKGEDFVRMQIIREADKYLSQINKAANKAEGKERKELRKLYNEQVKAVVDMLDEVGK